MKFRGILCPVVILTIILLSIASCNFGEAPDITVQDAMVIPSPMFIGTASAFMLITNDGKGSDVLIGCSIKEFPAVKGKLHNKVEGRMKEVGGIEIPSHKTTALRMGSLHLMLFGLPDNINDDVTLNLNFKKSGSIKVLARIEVINSAHRMNR